MGGGTLACIRFMSTTLIEVRRAKSSDASAIASTHDEAWRAAYQGIIPGPELDKLINRRGAHWWESAIRKGSRISILNFGEMVAGYANYGRNRARSLYYDGEIYELYLRPEFQGLGFGHKLFAAVRRDLIQSGLQSMVVWALSTNLRPLDSIARWAARRWPALPSDSAHAYSIRSPSPGAIEPLKTSAQASRHCGRPPSTYWPRGTQSSSGRRLPEPE